MCIGLTGSELKSNWTGLSCMPQLEPTAGLSCMPQLEPTAELGHAAVVVVGERGGRTPLAVMRPLGFGGVMRPLGFGGVMRPLGVLPMAVVFAA